MTTDRQCWLSQAGIENVILYLMKREKKYIIFFRDLLRSSTLITIVPSTGVVSDRLTQVCVVGKVLPVLSVLSSFSLRLWGQTFYALSDTLKYTTDHGRRKGGKGAAKVPLDFKIWYFPTKVLVEKCFSTKTLVVKWNFTTVGIPGKNPFGYPLEKFTIAPLLEKNPSEAIAFWCQVLFGAFLSSSFGFREAQWPMCIVHWHQGLWHTV